MPCFHSRKLYGKLAELQMIWTTGWTITTMNVPIRVSNVVAEHRCKPWNMKKASGRKNSWTEFDPTDHRL